MFREISHFDMTGNVFDDIFNGKMLITVKCGETINSMTASWGALGYLWKKPAATMYIRPQRYTLELLKNCEYYTLSFLSDKYADQIQYMGTHSGRNEDKYAATGLTPIVEGNYAYIGEASQVLFCRKMYDAVVDIDCASDYMKDMLSNQMYPDHDNHHMIYGEITKVIKQ